MTDRLLILGASSDIGMALAARLDGKVGELVLHGHSRAGRLEAFARQSRSRTTVLTADLADPSQVTGLIAASGQGIDGIVHLASPRPHMGRFKDFGLGDFDAEWRAQFLGPVQVLQHWMPRMAAAKRGQLLLLLTAPTLGRVPAGLAPYLSVKFALLGLMRSLAAEFGPKGVRVNAVSPGMVETGFLEHFHPTVVEQAREASPQGRLATPQDVAAVLDFILSDEAQHLHGANIPVDGGA